MTSQEIAISKIPDKTELVSRIKVNFPAPLLVKPIWLAYYFKKNPNGTYSKPPCSDKGHTIKEGTPGVTFEQACEDGYPGIKITESFPLVAFDIDDKEAKLGKRAFDISNLSPEFQEFMMAHDSYTELSPSKCGLRILAWCKDKTELPGRANLNPNLCTGGELFMSSGYVTITGDQVAGTDIATLTAEDIQPWYVTEAISKTTVTEIPMERMRLPALGAILNALKSCKLSQDDKVKKAYEIVMETPYNHYDFWIKIMASCHNYATLTGQANEVLLKVLDWCQTDSESFIDEADVIKHWSSFSEEEDGNKITFHTLLKFAQLLKFQWPIPMLDKEGNPTGNPVVTSYKNLAYLMDYYSLKFFEDEFSGLVYLTTDDRDIKKTHFSGRISLGMLGPYNEQELVNKNFVLAQENGYTATPFGVLVPLIKVYIRENTTKINILKRWLETEPKELSEDLVEHDTDLSCSTLKYLVSCIKFSESQDVGLAETFLDTFFFEMMMPIYNTEREFAQRSFMLVLTGPENCRKTTFFSMLFPSSLRRIFVTNSTETLSGNKSIRDFAASLVTSALVVTDEFEIFYNKKNDSLFKTYVTADTVDYTPIYEKITRKAYKNAVLAGTTNKRSLAFEQDSNRRLAMLDVKFIDTSKMKKINWHHFYRDYVRRGVEAMQRHEFPWKISAKTLKRQYEANEEFRAKTNLEIVLRELFDFDLYTHKIPRSFDSVKNLQRDPMLYSLKHIQALLKQTYPDMRVSIAEMKHTLKRLCSIYSDTVGVTKQLLSCEGTISNGIIKQTQHTRYFMPPRLTDF